MVTERSGSGGESGSNQEVPAALGSLLGLGDFRRLWITRISAACRMRGTRYSRFMNGLSQAGIGLNRKMLSQLAIEDPKTFDALVEKSEAATTACAAS